MPKEWEKFDRAQVEEVHGQIYFYRDLYEGNHAEIFARAQRLIDEGEIVDNIVNGNAGDSENVTTPYIVANICKLVAEIPATLISRSIGNIETSIKQSDLQDEAVNSDTKDLIDTPEQETPTTENTDENGEEAGNPQEELLNIQQEILNQIQKNSNLKFEHWGNIVQHQVDGGLVGVPWLDEQGLRLDFKARDVYFPHDDGLGADLVYEIEVEKVFYLHVYREQVIENNLHTNHMVYELTDSKDATLLEENRAKEILGMEELEKIYKGRGRPFIMYWANDKTIMNPLGVSSLKNQEGKQDDINWTLTRNAITFERNGKPRIAISQEIMRALQQQALERYGDETKIDHRDLEITTFDDNGRAMEVIQIDVSKIGDVTWVKDLIKLMLMETQTSEKAIDFYMDNHSSGMAQSGVAKYYDLFTSLLKSEKIQQQYIYFIQELFESALWLANYNDGSVMVEEPEIHLKSIIPISNKELTEENTIAFEKDAQSLETTVRRNNPSASEEWILEEIARIEESKSSEDSFSLFNGRQTMQQFNGNRDAEGNPIDNNAEGKDE